MDWPVILTVWLVCAVGAYLIAAQRGAGNPGTFGVAGILIGPLALVAAAFASPPKPGTAGRICAKCGKVVAPDREQLCNNCGEPFA